MFHEKGTTKHFPYLTRQVSKSWNMSNGCFHTKGQGKVTLKFIDYSNSKEYTVKPDVVKYDGIKMTKPAFDLILGVKTLRELGIVLDFRTREITIDEIILPMRDINCLDSRSKIEKAWSVNHSIIHEPLSTGEATQRAICILDATYEKADLQVIADINCLHLSVTNKNTF